MCLIFNMHKKNDTLYSCIKMTRIKDNKNYNYMMKICILKLF